MGKNQAYKAMQRARLGSASSAVPDQVEDGMVDGSFHSPEWHAARLASLNTSHTITWEEFKRKQKEDELRQGELEADTDKMMREYRAQLDAERAHKLAHGRNHDHSSKKLKLKPDRREKDSTKRRSKRKRSRRESSDSSSSSSGSSSSEDNDREERRSRSKRNKWKKKHRLKKGDDSGDDDPGPVPLSRFFQSVKS
ncbi:hypothetical protein MLD38_012052 [Melastoma candidum]|uniref:Uncharacterized protein n=1 Tax=Melastoma candidum TaxID=119954 RepID=A0ACB9RDH1_9MYRT|nr:hypothetical protein MLD38_012052 [Melastoma candidum]